MPFHSPIASNKDESEDRFSNTTLEAEPLAVLAHNNIAFVASPEKQ